jgi:hypothetical protein
MDTIPEKGNKKILDLSIFQRCPWSKELTGGLAVVKNGAESIKRQEKTY